RVRPAAAFLETASEDFGVVSALALAGRPRLAGRSPSAMRRAAIDVPRRCRNINRPSIGYACRPRLRVRLTLGGFTFPSKPQAFGGRDSHPSYRYSFRHDHWRLVQGPSPCPFGLTRHALLPLGCPSPPLRCHA